MRRAGAACAALALLVAGCGGPAGERAEEEGPARYGTPEADLTTTTTTTTTAVAAPPAPTRATPAPTPATEAAGTVPAPPPAPRPARVANRTEHRDPSGFQLSLVVADKLEFGPTENIVMELGYVNTSGATLWAHSDQRVHFVLATEAGETVWHDAAGATCALDVAEPVGIGVPIEPGEGARFVAEYPGKPTNRHRDRCRVAPGRYVVHGVLEWCPQARPDDRRCDGASLATAAAAPLAITIG